MKKDNIINWTWRISQLIGVGGAIIFGMVRYDSFDIGLSLAFIVWICLFLISYIYSIFFDPIVRRGLARAKILRREEYKRQELEYERRKVRRKTAWRELKDWFVHGDWTLPWEEKDRNYW